MNNRTLLKYHSYAGLIAGIFLILMGISGAILVFQHDIEELRWKSYIELEDYGGRNIDRAVRSVQEHYPGWDTRLIEFEEGQALIFNLRRPTARLFVFVHPTSGEIIKELNELTTFTRWLLKFHYSFQAGVPGRILVLVVGCLFLFSLVSGLFIYRRSVIKTLTFRTRVVSRTRRSLFSSLHRIVGVWAILLNLLLVITGLFLSYAVVTAALNPAAPPEAPPVSAPVETILEELGDSYPDFTPTYIRLPYNTSGSLTVYGIYPEDPFYFSEFYNTISADYTTGRITGVTRVKDASLWTKWNSMLLPLHFGQYGGIWSKLLYCLIGLSGPFLSVSGFLIWRLGKSSGTGRKKK